MFVMLLQDAVSENVIDEVKTRIATLGPLPHNKVSN